MPKASPNAGGMIKTFYNSKQSTSGVGSTAGSSNGGMGGIPSNIYHHSNNSSNSTKRAIQGMKMHIWAGSTDDRYIHWNQYNLNQKRVCQHIRRWWVNLSCFLRHQSIKTNKMHYFDFEMWGRQIVRSPTRYRIEEPIWILNSWLSHHNLQFDRSFLRLIHIWLIYKS